MRDDRPVPSVEPLQNGPYLVKGLDTLTNSRGEALATKDVIALCRCGCSTTKPFCSGMHKEVGFDSARQTDGSLDGRLDYEGDGITIHDNRGICAHAGFCTDNLPSVWRLKQEPWIDARGAALEEISAIVRMCPSGALSYSIDGVENRDQDRPPAILVSRNGPYYVTGGVELADAAWGEAASREHYALCRCGHSRNKPFCDGSHWAAEFDDPAN
jgi:CDGSH-type Zn-finger protein